MSKGQPSPIHLSAKEIVALRDQASTSVYMTVAPCAAEQEAFDKATATRLAVDFMLQAMQRFQEGDVAAMSSALRLASEYGHEAEMAIYAYRRNVA